MQNPAETMRKLRRLAHGNTNEAESETARQALAALIARYPNEASLLETPIEVDVPHTLKGDNDFELDLFVTISEFLTVTFGERLRNSRQRAGFTLTKLGALCDPRLSRASVCALEAGRQQPSSLQAQQLADALNVSRCWLAWGKKCDEAA